MKKNVLVVVLALYTAPGFSGKFDDLKQSGKGFATGFGIGLAHGSLRRVVYSPIERALTPVYGYSPSSKNFVQVAGWGHITQTKDEYLRLDSAAKSLAFFDFATLAGAIKVHEAAAHMIGNKDVTVEQLAGHALGQMVAEGFEINPEGKPCIVLSLNTTMALAVIKFLQGTDSEK